MYLNILPFKISSRDLHALKAAHFPSLTALLQMNAGTQNFNINKFNLIHLPCHAEI